MANEEHLNILRQGVVAWNLWRSGNPVIKPDLGETNLSEALLSRVNLSDTDLRGAILSETNLCDADLRKVILNGATIRKAILRGANFSNTDLSEIDLSETDLSRANLNEVILRGANLSMSDLSYVNLRGANLSKTDLSYANLRGANLRETNLSEANLSGATLRGSDLGGSDLGGADLSKASLSEASLRGANLNYADLSRAILSRAILDMVILSGAILSETDLSARDFTEKDLRGVCFQNANLQEARLINSNLDGANLTDARLWETQRAGWSINGVTCESVYWDEEAKVKTVYTPSEFERLFAEQTKILLFYKDGITPLEIATLPALIQHLSDSHPGCNLRFVSIHEDGGGDVVELAIEDAENLNDQQIKQLQTSLEVEAQRQLEYQKQVLIERTMRLQLEKQLDSFVDKLILRQGDTYNIGGQVGAAGPNAHAHHNTFNQLVNQFNQSTDLSALAKELSELRQAIKDKHDSSPQADIALVKVAEAEIAATEKDTAKVVEHLKSAGKWTMDFAKEIGKDVVAEAIKQAMGMP
jgi:uncharacterized protein YjbI with pentapeptide repeats